MTQKTVYIEWICRNCGCKMTRAERMGMPNPGICTRMPNMPNGKKPPHYWVENRRK